MPVSMILVGVVMLRTSQKHAAPSLSSFEPLAPLDDTTPPVAPETRVWPEELQRGLCRQITCERRGRLSCLRMRQCCSGGVYRAVVLCHHVEACEGGRTAVERSDACGNTRRFW